MVNDFTLQMLSRMIWILIFVSHMNLKAKKKCLQKRKEKDKCLND
jgi:hypothetical protein